MNENEREPKARVVKLGTGLAALCLGVFGAAHALNAWALDRQHALLDAGTGESLFERIGTLAILASTASVAYLAFREGEPILWILAGLLAFIALDDVLGLHEHIPGSKIVLLPILAPVFILLWRLRREYGISRKAIRIGLVFLAVSVVVGGIAAQLVSRQEWGPGDAGYETKILLKDGAEVTGWLLVATGLLAAVPPGPGRTRPA